jgi:hypothetical protein
MKAEKKPDEDIDFRGTAETKNQTTIKTKRRSVIIVPVILLGGAAIFLTLGLLLKKPGSSERLVDVNLEEGETLMYRVDQTFEVSGHDVQKGTYKTNWLLR